MTYLYIFYVISFLYTILLCIVNNFVKLPNNARGLLRLWLLDGMYVLCFKLTYLWETLLLNRGGGLWGLGIPREGGQVWDEQRQSGRSSASLLLEVDLYVAGSPSDCHFYWSWTHCRAEHNLWKVYTFCCWEAHEDWFSSVMKWWNEPNETKMLKIKLE